MICVCGYQNHETKYNLGSWKVNINASENAVLLQLQDNEDGDQVRVILTHQMVDKLIEDLKVTQSKIRPECKGDS